MIGFSVREGMNAVSFVEAVRFGIWAKLIAIDKGKTAYELLKAWGRVQEGMRGVVSAGLLPHETFRLYLCDALGGTIKPTQEAIALLLQSNLAEGTAAQAALSRCTDLASETARVPADHPSTPPPSNGQHGQKKGTRKA